jgi:hypothetical protein
MSGPELVCALHAALGAAGALRVIALANEGLIVEAPDATADTSAQRQEDVTASRSGRTR